jgi:hypothetical protein
MPLGGAAEELELDHAVLGLGVALGEGEGLELGDGSSEAPRDEDVRHAPLIAGDRDAGRSGRGCPHREQEGRRRTTQAHGGAYRIVAAGGKANLAPRNVRPARV